MKYFIFFTSVLIYSLNSYAQTWHWSNSIGSQWLQSGESGSVITDGMNVYIVGQYSGLINFHTDTLTSSFGNGLFIAKYDENGSELWVRGFNGSTSNFELVNAKYNSVDNRIYLSGRFYGQMIVGSDTLQSQSGADIYLIKMDISGNYQWAKSIQNPDVDDMGYIYIMPNGDLFLAGTLGDTANIDSTVVPSGGFFAKYDTSGTCYWVRKQFDGIEGKKICIAFDGADIIMAGQFISPLVKFDSLNVSGSGNSLDGYLSKFDSTGRLIWLDTFITPGKEGVSGLCVDSVGNIYITGGFQDSIRFNGFLMNNPGPDLFIVKYTHSGLVIWARQANAVAYTASGLDVAIDREGSCYVSGVFSGPASFGNYTVTPSDTMDMFLVRYDGNGSCLGVKNFGNASGSSVVVDNLGRPICSGGFVNTVSIGSTTLTSNGDVDIFFAKCEAFTAVDELFMRKSNRLEIYANPTSGTCNITIPDEFINEKNLTLTIYNLGGKFIKRIPINMSEEKIKLNLETEAKGVYHAFLSNGVIQYEGKIIFE